MDNVYLESMQAHIGNLEAELVELTEILHIRQLNRFEYRAAERTLQISIEASIGIAKHWCKSLQGVAPASAYDAFTLITELADLDFEVSDWKKVIGMRNALVDDYLNLDREVILYVIRNEKYRSIIEFSRLGLKAMKG